MGLLVNDGALSPLPSTSQPRRSWRASTAAAAVVAVLALGTPTISAPTPAHAQAGAAAYRPVTPCRLLDTRDAGSAKPIAGQSFTLAVRGRCGVAADATAVAVTLTVDEPAAAGFLTAWPSGLGMPLASSNNYAVGETRANGALLSLGADGALSLFTNQSAHIIVDVMGEFYPASVAASGRYVPLTPFRALDTRDGAAGSALPTGGVVTVPLPAGVPADATAMAVTLTITESPVATFVTAYPAGSERPWTSSLNTDDADQTRTATQIVPVSPSGLSVFSNGGGHIIVDVAGYFSGPSAAATTTGLFIPTTPTRVLDTRESGQIWPGGAVTVATAGATGSNAAAIAANVTITRSGPAGYVTSWAALTAQPDTPAVSYERRGETVANLSVVSVSTSGVALASTSGTHAVLDVTGWFTGTPLTPTTGPPSNNPPTLPQPTGPIGCLQWVPSPTGDGVYHIAPGSNQRVAHIFDAGPKGPIVVVGDSLTALSLLETARALRANGWGPICVDGTFSRTVMFGTSAIPDGLDAASRIRASDPIWDNPNVTWVVALGTNDVWFSAGDPARSDQYIAEMQAAIGPNPITWMNVRTGRAAGWQYREAMFNQSIAASGLRVVDWYGSMDVSWLGEDRVHLTVAGYQARADLLGGSVQPG